MCSLQPALKNTAPGL